MFLIFILFQIIISIDCAPWDMLERKEAWWQAKHNNFVNSTHTLKDKIKVIFYGDSITQGQGSISLVFY